MLQKNETEGPIVIIDHDSNDLSLIKDVLKSLHLENEIVGLSNSADAIAYLELVKVRPFLIFCEIDMPNVNGIDIRQTLYADEDIRAKTIPFLFLSRSSAQNHVNVAYEIAAQGYFIKPSSLTEMRNLLKSITNYWKIARRPPYRKKY